MTTEQFDAMMVRLGEIHAQEEAANLMQLRSNAVLLALLAAVLAALFFTAMRAVRRG